MKGFSNLAIEVVFELYAGITFYNVKGHILHRSYLTEELPVFRHRHGAGGINRYEDMRLSSVSVTCCIRETERFSLTGLLNLVGELITNIATEELLPICNRLGLFFIPDEFDSSFHLLRDSSASLLYFLSGEVT